ncbi:MAG: class I SAM-dependent methyltransferase [Bacteroidota bacterium]|nr:class I SAM-dependent methyltransferase [Bacteroidota bacterium]
MQYDPIKRFLGKIFNSTPILRVLFYKMLDLLLLRTWHIKKEIRQIRKCFPEKAEILDAGSGFGQYVYYISTLSPKWNIKGVDVKEEQIADCNRFFTKLGRGNRVVFEEADLTKYSEPERFDMILSVDVMEHILEDVEVFKNFNKSLKPGGVLLVSTPSDQGGSDVHDDHEASFVGEHVRDGYNIIQIEEKLYTAGFSKVEAYYSYGCPGKISWKLSMKYPILMVNTSKLFLLVLPFYYIVTFPFALILNYFDVKQKHQSGTGLIVKAFK